MIIIANTTTGHVVGVHSWTEGFVPLKCPVRRLTEREAVAHAMWLELHISSECALEFIDRWAAGYVFPVH
jgi:hypothetical protein